MMNQKTLYNLPIICTPKLVLRALQDEDAEPIFRLRSDAAVNLMVHRVAPASMQDAFDFIKKIHDSKAYYWAITTEEQFIGTICLFNLDDVRKQAEVGFELLPEYRGKGLMQESLTAICNFAFEELRVNALIAVVNPDNVGSLNLIRHHGFLPADELPIDVFPGDKIFMLKRLN